MIKNTIHSDKNMTADEKHISKLAGDYKIRRKKTLTKKQ